MIFKMLKEQYNKHIFIGQIYFDDVVCHGDEIQLWNIKLWLYKPGCLENVSLFCFKA